MVKAFAPLLLRVSTDVSEERLKSDWSVGNIPKFPRIRWRESLLCLFLCDSEDLLLHPTDEVLSNCLGLVENDVKEDILESCKLKEQCMDEVGYLLLHILFNFT